MNNKNNLKGFVFVNLLPFREQIKKEKLKQFYTILGFFAMIGVVAGFATYSLVSIQTEAQAQRNKYIEKNNRELDEDIKDIVNLQNEINDTLAKRKVVEALQVNRVDAVNILNEVSTQLPDGMKLTEISSKTNGREDVVTLKGTTNSNNKVSIYMTELVNSGVFIKPVLIEIKSNSNTVNNKPNTKSTNNNASLINNQFEIKLVLKDNVEQTELPVLRNTEKVNAKTNKK